MGLLSISWGFKVSANAAAPAAPTLTHVYQTIPTTATDTAYNAAITCNHYLLYWTDNSTDEDFFAVDVRVPGTYNSWSTISYLAKNSTSAYFSGLNFEASPAVPQGATIEWRVSACKGPTTPSVSVLERSLYSATVGVAYDRTPESGFSVPLNFTVTMAPGSDGLLHFTWNDISDKEEGYELLIRDTTGANNTYPTTAAYSFNFGATPPDVGAPLQPGKSYTMKIRPYRVTAYSTNSQNQIVPSAYDRGDFSNESTVVFAPLTAPTALAAEAVDEDTLKLTWADNSSNETNYLVQYRSPPGSGTYSDLGTVAANTITVPFDWRPGENTEWRVLADYEYTNSSNVAARELSSPSNAVTFALPFRAPTNLQVTMTGDTSNNSTATLTWTDNSSVETGFQVLVRPTLPANGAFVVVKTVNTPNVTSTTYTAALDPGVSYDWQVKAIDTIGATTYVSAASNIVAARAKDRITSRLYQPATLGQLFSFTVTSTTGAARTGFTQSGLPPGLGINATTGEISGTPTQAGVFNATISATFADGFTDSKEMPFRVVRPPAAPTTPLVVTSRTVGTGGSISIPLSTGSSDTSLFADPDSEQAVKVTTTLGDFTIILQPTLTPATVANFMTYVNAGDYNDVAFHRAPSGFVLQGGAFKPTSTSTTSFLPVTTRTSPLNEPGISNLIGTVAMAKQGGNPNSATHDFFVNLGDNSANLDNQNGGFTVFGRVAAGGMTVVNQIASLPKGSYKIDVENGSGGSTLSDTFDDWPMNAGSAPGTMDNTLVVKMNSVTSVPVLSYQVTNSNGTALDATISGGNLVLNGLVDGDSEVVVTATDLDGNPATQSFTVHVVPGYEAPNISAHPQALTKIVAQSAAFSVTAFGTNLNYQWKKGGVNIANATGPSYTINSVVAGDAGDYSVLVSNDAGFALSNAAHLTVQVPVSITTPPAPTQTVNYGSPVTFSVVAAGDPTITYQWRRGTTNIDGATSASYTINSALLTDAGSYNVVVTNPVNPPNNSVTSSDAVLIVRTIDTDGDGLTDDQELVHTTGVNNPDTDGDGFADGLEVGAGTDPKLASSVPASTKFYAQRDSAALLNTVPFKRLLGAVVPDGLAGGTSTMTIPDFWFATTELTNKQFAAILQRAKKDGLISINDEGSPTRRVVRYPATGGEIVCYLATPAPTTPGDPPSCAVDMDSIKSSFTVPVAVQDFPANAVSWHGAYLCTLVLNTVNGYTGKNLTATWSFDNGIDGFHLPSYQQWELAGRGISPTFAKPGLAYPTGGTVATSQAWFNQTAPTATTKRTASFAASRLGLFDLAGNVEEWVFEGVDLNHAYTRGGSYADPATELSNATSASLQRNTISKQNGVRLALRAADKANISVHPASKFQRTDAPLTLSVVASGPPPLTYQWYKNNVALSGKTSATLTIASPTLTDAGSYTVKVLTNGVNAVTSDPALVALVQATTPAPVTTIAALKGTTLTAKAAGAPGQTFGYQWKNTAGNILADLNFSNTTLASMVLKQMLPTHTGTYTCEVTLNGQTALPAVSTSVGLLVLQNPIITSVSFPDNLVVSRTLNIPIVVDSDVTRKPASFTITGLPKGLVYDRLTGTISGKPLVSGLFNLTIKATNAYGDSSTVLKTIVVNGLDAAATGDFVGLVARQSSATLNNDLGGKIDLTVQSTGNYTAGLSLGGTSYTMMGVLDAKDPALTDHDPTSTCLLARTSKPTLRLSFKISLSTFRLINAVLEEVPAGPNAATATATASATITGWRRIWDAKTFPANGYVHTTNISLTPDAGDPNVVPQGTGYARLTVAADGKTTWSGKLADGTAITGSSYMGRFGEVMHHQVLYNNTGAFNALMTKGINDLPVTANVGAIKWLKKPLAGRNYPFGFDVAMTPDGRYYHAPAANVIVADLTAAGAVGYPNNARVAFTSGGLTLPAPLPLDGLSTTTSLVKHFVITSANKVQMPTDILNNPKAVSFNVNASTGEISGTFTLSDIDTTVTPNKALSRLVQWYGLIIPAASPTKDKGLGFFTLPKMPNLAPNAHDKDHSEILSGKVVFDGVP